MAKKLSPEAKKALAEEFFADIFLKLMIGIIKADSVEADFAKIQAAARKLTQEQIHRIAALAGSRYAELSNPSPGKLPKGRVADLKKEAFEFALKQLEDETKINE
jgi:hypothetical protein